MSSENNLSLEAIAAGIKPLGWEAERHAKEKASQTVLIYEGKALTYAELNAGANRYANCFQELGLKKGDAVALVMKNRPEYLMAVIGLSKIGVIAALVDAGLRGEVMAHDINLCEARVVIVGDELREIFAEVIPRLRLRSPGIILTDPGQSGGGSVQPIQALGSMLEAASLNDPSSTAGISPDDILAYLYTPGYSGLRKAVAVSHRSCMLKARLFNRLGHMDEDTLQYMCLPLHYNGGFIGAVTAMIASGSAMVLRPEFSVHSFWDDIRSCKANYMITVGEIARYLYNQPPREDDSQNPLQVMVCNGMPPDLADAFRTRFGLKHIIEVYAKTEGVGIFANYEEAADMCGKLDLLQHRQGEVVKYDFHQQQIERSSSGWAVKCVPGETGLLLGEINQYNPFTGYINDPEASDQALIFNVFRAGDQYFNSGDMVQLYAQDYISYVDRLGDTFRWKGRTVSAAQVAEVLKKFYGGIEDALVYAVKVPGTEGRCGMAAVKLLEDEQLDWAAFMQYINRRMPAHARPVFIRIVRELEADKEEFRAALRRESYDPGLINDPIYILHPQHDQYVPLNREIYELIRDGKIPL